MKKFFLLTFHLNHGQWFLLKKFFLLFISLKTSLFLPNFIFRHLRDISFRLKNHPDKIEFNPDNTLKHLSLDIVNLNNYGFWEKIGVWKEDGLDIKDITWPASSPVPPPGVPEMFHLKVTYLEEPSFVNLNDPEPETGECKVNRAVRCRFAPEAELIGYVELTFTFPFTCLIILR